MNLFKSVRPLVQIAAELRRIANALDYFAVADARANNRMYVPKKKGWRNEKDESELFHTDDAALRRQQDEEQALFLQGGTMALEAEELSDLKE